MPNNRKCALTLAAALGLSTYATVASADSITFDFITQTYTSTSQPTSTAFTIPQTPLANISASGGTLDDTNTDGLGVGINNLIDNGEYVQFDFSPAVNLTSVSFTAFDDIPVGKIDKGDNPTITYSTDGTTYSSPFETVIHSGNSFQFSLIPTPGAVVNLRIAGRDATDSFGIGTLTMNYTPFSGSPNGGVSTPIPTAASLGFVSFAALALTIGLRKKLAARPV